MFRNLILTSALRERETSNGKGFSLGEALILHHDAAVANAGLAQVQAVTAADVRRVAQRYLTAENRTVATLVKAPTPAAEPGR